MAAICGGTECAIKKSLIPDKFLLVKRWDSAAPIVVPSLIANEKLGCPTRSPWRRAANNAACPRAGFPAVIPWMCSCEKASKKFSIIPLSFTNVSRSKSSRRDFRKNGGFCRAGCAAADTTRSSFPTPGKGGSASPPHFLALDNGSPCGHLGTAHSASLLAVANPFASASICRHSLKLLSRSWSAGRGSQPDLFLTDLEKSSLLELVPSGCRGER